MAFYFALLNVSAKKEETKHHKHRRRRHSIASVESPLLDYRLLPRPQMVDEDEEKKKLENIRGMKKSESNYSTGGRKKKEEVERKRTPDKKSRPKSREPSFRDNPRDSACSSSVMSEVVEHRKEKKKKEPEKPKQKKHLLEPQKKAFPPIIHPPPNSPAIVGDISPAVSETKGPSKQMGVVRPIFHRRRQSPPESTTSGSRRSSKGSQASLPRRDTPSSSNCSRRESEETKGIGGLVQASHKLAAVHLTRPHEKFPHFKRVTFNGSPLVIKNNFMGEPAVLVQKGHTVLRRSSTVAQPLVACGVDWWGGCADSRPGEAENVVNGAVEEDSRLKRLRPSLLRRRSTSDRGRVAFVLHNEGYTSDDQEKDRKNGNHGSYLKRAGTTKG